MDRRRCERCRKPFQPTNASQRYCSVRCRQAAEKQRQKPKRVPKRCKRCGGRIVGAGVQGYCSGVCHVPPEEVARVCKEIQEGWTDEERAARAGESAEPMSVPTARVRNGAHYLGGLLDDDS